MASPINAFWSAIEWLRKNPEWIPEVASFEWASDFTIGKKKWHLIRGVSAVLGEDGLAYGPDVIAWPLHSPEPARTWGRELPPEVRELVNGYKAKWHRSDDGPMALLGKDVESIDALAAEVSRLEGPQLTLPSPRSKADEGVKGFWNVVDCMRLASRFRPAQLNASASHGSSARRRWHVDASLMLDPRLTPTTPMPPLRFTVNVRTPVLHAMTRIAIAKSPIFRRVHERMTDAGFYGSWCLDDATRTMNAEFNWASWKLDDVDAALKRFDKTFRALIGSIQ